MEKGNAISIIAIAISGITFLYTIIQTKINSRKNLFSNFDLASQKSIENPNLLLKVHGLINEDDEEELRSIAYLSLILDSFQHYYTRLLFDNFKKLKRRCTKSSNFLNRVLKIEANQKRWEILKITYYGKFDEKFIDVIDSIIKHENTQL